jgi:predicted signal transduction protein with EAL and GGDEF domain
LIRKGKRSAQLLTKARILLKADISDAEGVETQQQLEKLQSAGCTEMQGYLFSRARPAAEVEQLFMH